MSLNDSCCRFAFVAIGGGSLRTEEQEERRQMKRGRDPRLLTEPWRQVYVFVHVFLIFSQALSVRGCEWFSAIDSRALPDQQRNCGVVACRYLPMGRDSRALSAQCLLIPTISIEMVKLDDDLVMMIW